MTQAPSQHQAFRFSLPNTGIAPKFARELLVHLLHLTGHSEAAGSAKLLVSEVVANVYVHTDTPMVHVDVTVSPSRIRVAVWDNAPGACPAADPPSPEAEGGRGLLLVQSISSEWGVNWPANNQLRQKHVWFALDTDEKGAAA
ncbi:ATP-binding protein [Streptomyces inhibens]|uniref:ATP-binding protein n=1 Tax=Streptomyces inhibens TaxID=2293571 RepID=UPI00402AFDFB